LHDGRVVNFEVRSKTRRRCIEVASTPQEKDIFYWPMMRCETNKDKHGDSGEQSLNNQYQTRIPSKDYMTFADFTVYSMWNSFVSFTQNLNDENQSLLSELDAPKDENPEESLLNIASNMHRLPAFIELASRQLTFGSPECCSVASRNFEEITEDNLVPEQYSPLPLPSCYTDFDVDGKSTYMSSTVDKNAVSETLSRNLLTDGLGLEIPSPVSPFRASAPRVPDYLVLEKYRQRPPEQPCSPPKPQPPPPLSPPPPHMSGVRSPTSVALLEDWSSRGTTTKGVYEYDIRTYPATLSATTYPQQSILLTKMPLGIPAPTPPRSFPSIGPFNEKSSRAFHRASLRNVRVMQSQSQSLLGIEK
jgi:hypothetical protein